MSIEQAITQAIRINFKIRSIARRTETTDEINNQIKTCDEYLNNAIVKHSEGDNDTSLQFLNRLNLIFESITNELV